MTADILERLDQAMKFGHGRFTTEALADAKAEIERLRRLANLVREYDAEWAATEAGAPDHARRADIRRQMFEV